MWSVRSLRSESSTASVMFFADSPLRCGHEPTFVARTTASRLPREDIHSPMIVSDSPPELPGARQKYESAVSTKLPPAATYASRTANDVSRSAVQPNTLPPRQSRETSRSLEPIFTMVRAYDSQSPQARLAV